MKTILFISSEDPLDKKDGGIANYINKFSKDLSEKGIRTEVLFVGKESKCLDKEGVRYHSFKPKGFFRLAYSIQFHFKKRLAWDLSLFTYLSDALFLYFMFRKKAASYDLIQISNVRFIGLFFTYFLSNCAVRISASRVLYEPHAGRRAAWIEALEVRMMKQSQWVYAPSQYLASYFNRRYSLQVDVLRNYLIKKLPDQYPKVEIKKPYMVFVGHISERKGIGVLWEAIRQVVKKVPDFNMQIIGKLNDPTIKKMIHQDMESELSAHIQLVGVLAKEEVYRRIASSRAMVVPSLVDNLPNTALEAASLNTLLLCSSGTGADELVVKGVNGEVFENGNSQDLAEKIQMIWHEHERYQFNNHVLLKEFGKEKVMHEFLKKGKEG